MKRSALLILLMSLVLISLINLVSAEEIIIDYPDGVVFGEEFKVDLELINFEENIYDVKIDIKNSGNHRISKIWNGDAWQSTYNYVNDVIDTSSSSEGVFRLNITEQYEGTASLEVKVRNIQGNVDTFNGYSIEVTDEGSDEEEEEKKQENNETENNEETNENEIRLEIDWDEDDITNGDEFDITVKAFNLRNDNYDIRIWIEFEDNDTVISDRYDDDEGAWNSGRYYIDDFFKGLGDKEDDITLRIRKDHEDYEGDAIIFVKLRDGVEINESIEILEYKDEEEEEDDSSFVFLSDDDEEEDEEIKETVVEESNEVIYLGRAIKDLESEDIKSQDNILYESGIQQIKKFSIYAFALLCVLLCILLFWNKF